MIRFSVLSSTAIALSITTCVACQRACGITRSRHKLWWSSRRHTMIPFSVGPNGLGIIARKNPAGKWESGLLSSTDPMGNGFAQPQARMKMPSGPGVWLAAALTVANNSLANGLHAYGDEMPMGMKSSSEKLYSILTEMKLGACRHGKSNDTSYRSCLGVGMANRQNAGSVFA
jgi:hypothetical protein